MHLTKMTGGRTFATAATRLLALMLVNLLATGTAKALTTNLVFSAQPASTVYGATFSNVVVQLRDSRGTNISLGGIPIALTLFRGSGLTGVTNISTDATGKSVFTNLVLAKIGSGYRLQATAAKFARITSGAFNITQGKTLNVLSTATNVINYGQVATITTKISVLAPAAGLPTGTVVFKDGSATLATVTLVSAQASFTLTNRLLVGAHGLTAAYSGDTNFAGSTSSFTLTVAKQALTVSGVTASNKVYDSLTTATLNTNSATLVGVLSGDTVGLNTGAAKGAFGDKNVGTGKTVGIIGLTISGTSAANYSLTQPTATASITAASLAVSAKGASKTYDGTAAATVTLSDNRIGGDVFTDSYVTAQFTNKLVGTAKTILVAGISIVGADAANYFLANTNATTTGNIVAAALTVSGITASNKVYDAKTTAGLNFAASALVGQIAGDGLKLVTTNAKGFFASKMIGLGKTVVISGLTVSGTNASNYTLTQPTATANITAASLTVTAKGVNKIYDGTADATVTLSDNRIAGDVFTDSYAIAAFTNSLVGTNKNISVTGISVSGADATNYFLLNTNASTTASITAAKLLVAADNLSRAFGVTNPPLTYTFTGLVNGETAVVLSGKPTLTTTAKTNSAVTNYPITIVKGTLASSNYVFSFTNGVLSVTPADTAALLLSNVNPARTNQNITFVTRVSARTPGSLPPSGQVRFKCNGTNTLGNLVSLTNGATTLVIPAASLANSSVVVVTAEFADPAGNFSSSSNSLSQIIVIANPTIGQVSITPPKADGTFQASLAGTPGQAFVLQASSDLLHWTNISTNIADASGVISIVQSNAVAFPSRYFRGMMP